MRAGTRSRTAQRHRSPRAPLRGARRSRSSSTCAACSPSRSGTRASRRLVLARDPFGIKPLYYARAPTGCWRSPPSSSAAARSRASSASSTRGARRLPGVQLDPGPADASSARPASSRRAHVLVREDGRTTITATPGRTRPPRRRSDADARARRPSELRDGLRDSVRAHLVADVPVGRPALGRRRLVVLAALAAGRSPEPLKTFSIGFEERAFYELDRARLVARALRHRPSRAARASPTPIELLPRIASAFDEPFADSSALPTYLVSELAASTSRSRSPARGATSCSAATTPTSADSLAARSAGQRRGPAWPLLDRLPSGCRRHTAVRRPPQALRARWHAAAAGAAHRLERGVSRRRARGAARATGPTARSTGGAPRAVTPRPPVRAAGPLPGPRPGHLPGGRPAAEDRPRQHGPLAGVAGPVPGPRDRRARALSARRTRSAGWRRSACCARRRGRRSRRGDRGPEAGILDSRPPRGSEATSAISPRRSRGRRRRQGYLPAGSRAG